MKLIVDKITEKPEDCLFSVEGKKNDKYVYFITIKKETVLWMKLLCKRIILLRHDQLALRFLNEADEWMMMP